MTSIFSGEYLSFSSANLASASSYLIASLSAASLFLVMISVTSLMQSKSSALHMVNAYSLSAAAYSSGVNVPPVL